MRRSVRLSLPSVTQILLGLGRSPKILFPPFREARAQRTRTIGGPVHDILCTRRPPLVRSHAPRHQPLWRSAARLVASRGAPPPRYTPAPAIAWRPRDGSCRQQQPFRGLEDHRRRQEVEHPGIAPTRTGQRCVSGSPGVEARRSAILMRGIAPNGRRPTEGTQPLSAPPGQSPVLLTSRPFTSNDRPIGTSPKRSQGHLLPREHRH